LWPSPIAYELNFKTQQIVDEEEQIQKVYGIKYNQVGSRVLYRWGFVFLYKILKECKKTPSHMKKDSRVQCVIINKSDEILASWW
jgi:hypothetical protein